jgi:hypothetical protein
MKSYHLIEGLQVWYKQLQPTVTKGGFLLFVVCCTSICCISTLYPYEHIWETKSDDLEIHKVITDVSLSIRMSHTTERIISHRCNIHAKSSVCIYIYLNFSYMFYVNHPREHLNMQQDWICACAPCGAPVLLPYNTFSMVHKNSKNMDG